MLTLMPADVNGVVDQRLKQALSDFKFPIMGCSLREAFPFLGKIFSNYDRMLLQECICISMKGNIDDVLKAEVVALCVFILFIRGVPHPLKEVSACALASIAPSPGFRGIQDVSNQEEVENFLLHILGSGSGNGNQEGSVLEVQRQVCLSISLLASWSDDCSLELVCYTFFDDIHPRFLELQFGLGINDKLLQLIRDPSCSSRLTSPLLCAIANIALISQDMTEKIFKAEVSECWLAKLIDKEHDDSFPEAACLAVACIASYACREENGGNTELWNVFKFRYVPFIVKCLYIEDDFELTIAGALALIWITKCAKSETQMDDLVDGGCLKAFFRMNTVFLHNDLLSTTVEAISTILKFGYRGAGKRKRRRSQVPKYNKYVELVNGFECGWDVLDADKHWEYYRYDIVSQALGILEEYCPQRYHDATCKLMEESDLEASSSGDDESDDEEKNKMTED